MWLCVGTPNLLAEYLLQYKAELFPMNIDPADLVIGVMVSLFGLAGRFLASRALDDEIYLFGLSLAAFSILFVFSRVHSHFDREDRAAGGRHG